LAAVVLLLTFRPVYRWTQAGARDLIYGQHESPYPALAQLNQQLESTLSPQSILPTIAATIAEALRLPYVEIEAYRSDNNQEEMALTTSYGAQPVGVELEAVPLLYHSIKIGELRVAAQRWDVPLSRSDLSVLNELARQVGISLYAAQLTDDLQRARERLVLGREEERRRIRNDLHDGLAPTLSSLQLQLSAIRHLIQQDPKRAEASINELSNDLRAATAEIRQLIYDLRPPMLDDLGLVAAVRNFKLNDALRLEVDAPDPLPKLPAALEVALYRIASEALHNVVRHANATQCRVCLQIHENQITLSITDNGTSPPDHYTAGIGLHSMRERAEELSGSLTIQPGEQGGTQVIAQLPITF
jgi:signal transduction histidine kinase